MKYFTRGWANGELGDLETDRVREAYVARLEAIAAKLPPPMARLGAASLHDALIESVRWKPSAAELRVALVAGDSQTGYESVVLTYRGAMLGEPRIESLRRVARDREACVLYDEVDLADDGALVHRLLFWPNEELTIEFRELEYSSAPRPDRRLAPGSAFVVEPAATKGG